MKGMGIWIFLLLFYLLQAFVKRKRKQQLQQETEEASSEPQVEHTPLPSGEPQRSRTPQKPQRPISLEELFNPEKLRDMLGVPQPESVEEPKPEPVSVPERKPEMRQGWEEVKPPKPAVRETVSKVGSADITDVDESVAEFKARRMAKSDITSDRFDERKTAPGKKRKLFALDYFDEPEDIRNAVILKEILDRPRAFRRQIR